MQQWNIVSICPNRLFTQFKVEQKSVWFSNLPPVDPTPNLGAVVEWREPSALAVVASLLNKA